MAARGQGENSTPFEAVSKQVAGSSSSPRPARGLVPGAASAARRPPPEPHREPLGRRDRGALVPPDRGARSRPQGQRDGHERHGERQVAGPQPAGTGHAGPRPARPRPYLYPTKALAQDQARKLSELGGRFLRHAIYDGDTPREERRAIRQRSNLILTNPDMLHVGVLPNHRSWGTCSPISPGWWWTRRTSTAASSARTWRTCCAGSAASLTPTAPGPDSCSPARPSPTPATSRRATWRRRPARGRRRGPAERRIAIWNPPLVDERSGTRASVLSEAAGLLAQLMEQEVRTICFLKSRRGVELIQRFTRLRLEDAGRGPGGSHQPYRALHALAAARDRGPARQRDLLAVVATDALELGIDIGDLDAAICVTFPGTVASLRQMGPRRPGAAPGWRCTWPARTRSTSSSAATPTSSSTVPWSRRSSTPSRRRSICPTSPLPPTSCP